MKFCPQCGSSLAAKTIDERERMACESACGFIHWNNPTPVVAALVKVGDEFVLARNAAWPAGFFSLISGFLEAGEAPDAAIARETLEELGLEVERAHFVGHYPFARLNQIIMAYVVEAVGDPVPNAELAELRRFSAEELQSHDFGPIKLATMVVRDWFGGDARSDRGLRMVIEGARDVPRRHDRALPEGRERG